MCRRADEVCVKKGALRLVIESKTRSGWRLHIQRRGLHYGWLVLTACLILITVSYALRLSFGIFFKPLEQDFGWNRALTSAVFSVHMLVGLVFAVLASLLADRYGTRAIFIVMGLASFFGLVLASRATEIWQMFLGYGALVAVGTGATYPLATSTVTRWFQKNRGLALAIVTSGAGLGSILITPIASYLIGGHGWRDSYLAMAIMSVAITVPCALALRRTPGEIDALSATDGQAANPGPPDRTREAGESTLLQLVKTRNFLFLLSIWFLYSFCLFLVMAHVVRHAIDSGIDPVQAASIISIIGFASIPSRILMGLASDKFGRNPAGVISAGLMAMSMLWLVWASDPWMLYVFALIFGTAFGGLTPPTSALVADIWGLRRIGALFGLLEIGWATGASAGPALAGYIFDVNGDYSVAFWIGGGAALMIAILLFFVKTPAVKSSNRRLGRR